MIIAKGKVNGKENIEGNCEGKCRFSFNYSSSDTLLTFNDNIITITPTTVNSSSVPPMTFNGNKYTVEKIEVVSPSYHLYDTANGFLPLEGELLITHAQIGGASEKMILTVPLSSQSRTGSTSSTKLITDVIEDVYISEEKPGTRIQGPELSLNSVIPDGEFFMYTRTTDNIPVICYGRPVAIYVGDDTIAKYKSVMTSMSKVSHSTPASVKGGSRPVSWENARVNPFPNSGALLYLNPNGPDKTGTATSSSEIYIDCRPTQTENDDSYKESVLVGMNKKKTKTNTNKDSKIFSQVLFAVFLAVLLGGIAYAYNRYFGAAPSTASLITKP